MAIPSAVKKQGEESERLLKEQQEALNKVETEDPSPAETIEPVEKPPVQVDKKIDPSDWKARFDGLQQTHKDYKASTEKKLVDQSGQLAQLSQQVIDLQGSMIKTPPEPDPEPTMQAPSANEVRDMLSEDEQDNFSPEMLSVIAKVASGIATKTLEGVSQKVDTFAKDSAQQKNNRFFELLTDAHPTWREIQKTPEFYEWVNQQDPLDPMGQRTYQNKMDEAHGYYNSACVVALFNEYKAYLALKDAAPAVPEPKDPLANKLVPEAAGGVGDEPAVVIPTFSQSYIEEFYTNATRGKYTPAEYASIDKQINQALAAGRITVG